jgi:hypothetical protein
MAKSSSKSTAVIERLLEERRQYEAWITRLDAAGDATPENVRTKVRADYHARLLAVTEELKAHAEEARQLIAQKQEQVALLAAQEKEIADRLKESELRHAVGEYDETQWTQVHKDALAELLSVREQLKAGEADIAKLEELDRLVKVTPGRTPPVSPAPERRPGPPATGRGDDRKRAPVDELAFLKSVTEDDNGPSPRRAGGSQFQPDMPASLPAKSDRPSEEPGQDGEKTLKCPDCGTMNLPTEWYCERCGAELAAL